jgi:hypothetical protein
MISGIVTDRHAIVSLTFLLVNGATFPIEFVFRFLGVVDRMGIQTPAKIVTLGQYR